MRLLLFKIFLKIFASVAPTREDEGTIDICQVELYSESCDLIIKIICGTGQWKERPRMLM